MSPCAHQTIHQDGYRETRCLATSRHRPWIDRRDTRGEADKPKQKANVVCCCVGTFCAMAPSARFMEMDDESEMQHNHMPTHSVVMDRCMAFALVWMCATKRKRPTCPCWRTVNWSNCSISRLSKCRTILCRSGGWVAFSWPWWKVLP